MGIFQNLFGKPNSNESVDSLIKTSTMLDEDLYWKIVHESLGNSSDQDTQENYLINRIKKLSLSEIIGFRLRTDKFLYDTYNSEMWCAGYILNGGCSDDGFEYFRNWVISRGRTVYYNAKGNPDSLVEQIDDALEFYDFESFWYVALEAFEQRTGKSLYDFIDYDNFQFSEGAYPSIEFTWTEKDPPSMRKICPNLFDRLWDQ